MIVTISCHHQPGAVRDNSRVQARYQPGAETLLYLSTYLLHIYISTYLIIYYHIYPESCEERGCHHHGAEEAGEGLGGEPVGVQQVPRTPETGDSREHS